MPAPKRKPVEKKPAERPAPQETPKPVTDEQLPAELPHVEAPAPEPELAPEHVRTLARTIRRHLGNPRIHFDAAPNVPVMFGYQSLFHVVNGHPAKPIATRDELSEMTDQQMYDKVMAGRQAPRQGFPAGGRG